MLPSKQQQQQRRWRREQEGSKQPQPQHQQQQHWAMSSRLLMNSTLCLLLLPLLTLTTTTAGAKMTAGDNQELGVGQWGRQVGLEDQQQQHHHRRYQQQRNRGSADSLPARHSSSGGGGGGGRCDREADVTTLRHRIIRPQDSVSAGARFVSAPRGVSRWRDCLSACCVHAGCSVAVLQGAPGDDDDGGDDGGGGDDRDGPELNCYLFDCPRGQDGRDVCSFSTHQGYTSFVLSENGRAHGGDGGGDGDHDEKEEMDRKDEDPERGRHEGEPGGRDGEEDQPPQAQAGADVMLRVPESSATLSGLGSVDDHGITAYRWGLLSGDPSVQMASSEDGQLKLSGLREGVYVLRLTVTDTANQQGSDEVVITVLPSPVHAPVPSHDPPELPLPAKAPTVAQDVHNISEKMYPQPFPAQPLSMQTNPGAMQKQVDAVYVAPESSAVLPLALGLAVTVLLLVMLGGRFFVARKRLKKGRPLVSEESDYLINGMYL